MELLSKPKQALKKIMDSIGRPDIFEKIVRAQGKKQRHDTVVYAFKQLASELPKTDMSAVRQLSELIANVQDETLRQQLEAIIKELFTPEKQKGLPFYQVELQKPTKFDYSIFHKTNSKNKSFFQRMFGRGK